jgi:hypothetical protein
MARILKGGWGGKRPGAGRPRKRPLPPPTKEQAALLDALRQLADGGVTLKQRLDRPEQAGVKQDARLAKTQEALKRILRHQAVIARQLGVLEPPRMPRTNRRRPLE